MIEPPDDFDVPLPDYENTPITRSEYIAALVHLYRGELFRANSWRLRLDHTTNWSILTTAGLLSFSFSEPQHTHWSLLIGLSLVSVFWLFESRRYRMADIWYVRLRLIEENFYGPILRRNPASPKQSWGELLSRDMFDPRFKMGRLRALKARLQHNYWAVFGVLLASWCLKILLHPVPAHAWRDLKPRLGEGLLPWWLPLTYIAIFLGFLAVVVLAAPPVPKDDRMHWNFAREGSSGPPPPAG
ncbi:MAG: DUF2270 domain-containing protein [Planctomycetota bacterium]